MLLREIDSIPEGEYYERELRGPILFGVTYEPYTITLYVKFAEHAPRPGSTECPAWEVYLKMHHGGGTFFYDAGNHLLKSRIDQLRYLPDAELFTILFSIWKSQTEGMIAGAELAANKYQKAFVDGKLKKRKHRNSNSVKVWIEQ